MAFKDYFSRQSTDYAHYRPRYPEELFCSLSSLCTSHDCAWDCATGNGQAAVSLADYFHQVVATDGSLHQLGKATPHPRVRYQSALAEQSGLAEQSIDLVTVAQAVHWFDLNRFYAEVKRVLKPGGVLALWCYELMHISPELDPIIEHFYHKVVGDFWPPERALVEDHYQSLPFPFDEIILPSIQMTTHWCLDQVCGYLFTWSASQNYVEVVGRNPLEEVGDRLLAAWGDAEQVRAITWPIHLRVGRVEE